MEQSADRSGDSTLRELLYRYWASDTLKMEWSDWLQRIELIKSNQIY